jgi:hypothetical protein
MAEFVLKASVPFEMFSVESLDEIVRLLTASTVDEERLTVMPGWLITTSSDGPGRASALQLDGVSQSPPLGLTQVTVESNVRSSSRIGRGRKLRGRSRRAFADVGLNNDLGNEVLKVQRIEASPGSNDKDRVRDETIVETGAQTERPGQAGPVPGTPRRAQGDW